MQIVFAPLAHVHGATRDAAKSNAVQATPLKTTEIHRNTVFHMTRSLNTALAASYIMLHPYAGYVWLHDVTWLYILAHGLISRLVFSYASLFSQQHCHRCHNIVVGFITLSSVSPQVVIGVITLSSVSRHCHWFHNIVIGFITLSSIGRVIPNGVGAGGGGYVPFLEIVIGFTTGCHRLLSVSQHVVYVFM